MLYLVPAQDVLSDPQAAGWGCGTELFMESEQDDHHALPCFLALKICKFCKTNRNSAVRHPHSNPSVTANQKLSLFLSDLNSEKNIDSD